MPPGPERARSVARLLADLGPQLQRGGRHATQAPSRRYPCGLTDIDALLEGGFPSGQLSEITGVHSSGRTSLVLSLLARTTGASGELAAVVDPADAFDPKSAEAAGVDLDRVLWARVQGGMTGGTKSDRKGDTRGRTQQNPKNPGGDWQPTLRCTERLIEAEGIPLVVLDLALPAWGEPKRIPTAAWLRLARLAAGTRAATVIVSSERLVGAQAQVALEMQPVQACFGGSPLLFEALESRAQLVRHRAAPLNRTITVRLGASAPAGARETGAGGGEVMGGGEAMEGGEVMEGGGGTEGGAKTEGGTGFEDTVMKKSRRASRSSAA